MKDPLTRLTEKTSTLGNYNHKYLHIISTNIDPLTAALEKKGIMDRVRLWNYSMEVPGEMDTVLQAASGRDESLAFLGCYYSLQFLHMNLRMIDIVKLDLATSREKAATSKKFMLEAGRMFRYLTKGYMQRLLKIFLEDKEYPEFVMLGVGTRSDQDDIDLGIVHSGLSDPGDLNHAISRLASQMFKTATRLHFHLSEFIGKKSLSATIDAYEEVLERNEHNFIIVNEMLGAATILGSYPLYEQFRRRVTDRFYFDPKNRENRFHEGYLRGILGEIRAVLSRPMSSDKINPKEDALRPIKGLLSALKLVHGVDKVNAWNIIDELKEKDPRRIPQYEDLERTLTFFELFRHLYQITVAQDEDITLGEERIGEMLAMIAGMIGYEDKGVVSAKDFMLVFYYEFLENSMRAIEVLTGDLKAHLREVSLYGPIFSGDIHRKPGYEGNLAVDFIRTSSFLEGITYWDDFLGELVENDRFYNEFIESFNALPERILNKIARSYIAGTRHDPAPILMFLNILGRKSESGSSRQVFHLLSGFFIKELKTLPSASASLAQILGGYSQELNSFLSMLNWKMLEEFVSAIESKPGLPELIPYHNQLLTLANVHYRSSRFFKRHLDPILKKYPEFIRKLHNNKRLKEVTAGFYSDLTSLAPLDKRIERLGDFYDMEFVRVSMLALEGASSEQTDAEFIEFCDNYTQSLYDACQQDVHLTLGYSLHTHDLFALYAAGGHAREQGFDDDYDMIVILDSSEQDKIDYCNMIVARMNLHILKRGILPHHKFADYFGRYVVSLDELAGHIAKDTAEVFVDQSQILGSRLLVGSSKFDEKLQSRIIEPYIFSREREFIDFIVEETRIRHSQDDDMIRANMKECIGGQRDIEMLLLVYKTKYRFRDPLSRKLLARLSEVDTRRAEEFAYLLEHLNFMRNLRSLYRLRVAAHDVIEKKHLPPIAECTGYGSGAEGAEKLYDDFMARTERAGKVISNLMSEVWS